MRQGGGFVLRDRTDEHNRNRQVTAGRAAPLSAGRGAAFTWNKCSETPEAKTGLFFTREKTLSSGRGDFNSHF